MARNHSSTYQKRDTAAKAEGWSGYGQKRTAQKHGIKEANKYKQFREHKAEIKAYLKALGKDAKAWERNPSKYYATVTDEDERKALHYHDD